METTAKQPLHRLLREVLRGYNLFEEHCALTGRYEITFQGHTFNFLDLQKCLEGLTNRQMEAVYWFIIQDEKQKTVAERLGISTVTVGQYCEASCIQIARKLFPDHYSEETK